MLAGELAQVYERDFWNQFKGRALGVVRPSTIGEVVALVNLCRAHRVPMVAQGGNTGLVNGGIPDSSGGELLISLTRLNRIRKIDAAGDYLIAEAGCVLADVQKAAVGVDRYFPLTLGAEGTCTIGGNIATNAGGNNVLRYGMTRDLVIGIEAVLADGAILECLRPLRKDNTGYDLKQLIIGSEGTLAIITAAALRLVAPPRETVTLWMAMASPQASVDLFRRLRGVFGDLISSFELLGSFGVEAALMHLPGVRRPTAAPHPWHLLIELSWSFTAGLKARALDAMEELSAQNLCLDATIAESEAQRLMMWHIREGQSEAARRIGEIVRSDVSVPIADIPELIERVGQWTRKYGEDLFLSIFGHVGDGNLHMNFIVPPARFDELRDQLLERLYDEVDRLGGSISAEHGVGRAKREGVARRKPALALKLMGHLKRIFDPTNLLNPGVVLAAPTLNGSQDESEQNGKLKVDKTRG